MKTPGSENETSNKNPTEENLALSDFFEKPRVTSLFAVFVGTGTIISLLPIFLDFLLGSNWNHILLKSPLGYVTFLLILVAALLGVIFMIFISFNIFIEFYKRVIKQNYSITDKFISSMTMLCCFLSFFAISLILIDVWAIKAISNFDFISSFTLIYFMLLIAVVLIVTGIIIVISTPQKLNLTELLFNHLNVIVKKWGKLILVAAIFLAICLLAYQLWISLSPPVSLILNYYNDTNKSIDIGLSFNESIENNTPTLLHLRQTATKVNNIGVDLYYLDCRWSTNFGHFVEINSNNSDIISHQQEVIFSGFPQCPANEDNVFWTYDISEYGRDKPDVIIGFTMKDSNKGTLLGSNYLNLTWKDKDFLEIVNETN